MLPPSFEKFETRCAQVFSVISWCALVYIYFHDASRQEIGGGIHTIVPVNVFSLLALISGLVSTICSLTSLDWDITDRGAWLFVIWCLLPFLLTLSLLNPFGRYTW